MSSKKPLQKEGNKQAINTPLVIFTLETNNFFKFI